MGEQEAGGRSSFIFCRSPLVKAADKKGPMHSFHFHTLLFFPQSSLLLLIHSLLGYIFCHNGLPLNFSALRLTVPQCKDSPPGSIILQFGEARDSSKWTFIRADQQPPQKPHVRDTRQPLCLKPPTPLLFSSSEHCALCSTCSSLWLCRCETLNAGYLKIIRKKKSRGKLQSFVVKQHAAP